MSAKLRAVLWDLDGTLADSEDFHSAATVAALAEHGISASRGRELIGQARPAAYQYLCERYQGVPDYPTFSAQVDRHLIPLLADTRPIAASFAALQRFAGEGRSQYVVSNSLPNAVAATLAALDADRYIRGWIANDGKAAAKPAADPYLRALAAIGCDPDGAVVIEDSHAGTASAHAAGLFVIGVGENHDQIGADASYATFPDLSPEQIIAGVGK